jgi:phage/plasmid-like protein (TIGR03299 family)
MAHMIDESNGRANICYIGERPWHGMGTEMADGADLDQWRIAAGLNHSVLRAKVQYQHDGELRDGEGSILLRSDNGNMLSHVTDRYKIVQPKEVIEFYRDLCDVHGFKMETAGALSDGKRIWALARTGEGFTVGRNDRVENYLMLATSYDKSMATRAMMTTVRVVCHNTLTMAVANKNTGVSIGHSAMFDAAKVKIDLGVMDAASGIMADAFKAMTERKVSNTDAMKWIAKVVFEAETQKQLDELSTKARNIVTDIFTLYNGKGKGSSFETANGTAFGLMNAITEHVDHHASRNVNNRLQSAWFGAGDKLKEKAYTEALALAA